jgi:nucleoside phosphorylase
MDAAGSIAIIEPRRGRASPVLGPVAVLAATEPDLALLRGGLGFGDDDGRRLFISRLYTRGKGRAGVCLAGPMVGAPYAVMIAETLIAWGARTLVFLGWCGAVSGEVAIGDLVLPTAALIDEGTSRNYLPGVDRSAPSNSLVQRVMEVCAAAGVAVRSGPVWTTDAVFRETRGKVRGYQRRGALAVEMETSALFAVGAFRAVDTAALLVVSDDLSTLSWRPGFKDPRFARGRQAAAGLIDRLCAALTSAPSSGM